MDSHGSQVKLKGVPQFSSFRPPPTSPPAAATGSEHDPRRRRSGHRQRADRKESPRSRRHERRSDVDRQKVKVEQSKERLSGEGVDDVNVANDAANKGFVVDSLGDRDNTRYGVDRYDVPAYHRNGNGFVLGLPGQRIDYKTRYDQGPLLILRPDSGSSATSAAKPLSAETLSALSINLPLRLRSEINAKLAADNQHAQNFISTTIPSSQPGLAPSVNLDDDPLSYRSIHIPDKSENEAAEDFDATTITRLAVEAEILNRNAKLNRAVVQKPNDIQAWIRLAEHQELAVTGDHTSYYGDVHLVARAKLYVYEKAIKLNAQNPERDHLVLARMEEGAKVWDAKKLALEWEEVLCHNSEFITVWIEYLDYCQTDSQDFNFDNCLKTYAYCLKTHSRVGFGPQKSLVRSYLLLRLTLFLRESGHVELAVGLWQAVLEFTCFRPSHLMGKKEEALVEFKKFWAPGHARIGEPLWKPWNSGKLSRVHVNKHVYTSEADIRDLLGTWAPAERERMFKNRMPSHTFDRSKEDDGFQVVLLQDCTQILPYFWDLNESLGSLVDGFLYFCHLPHLTFPANMHTSRLWTGDNFLRNEYMDDPRNTIADWINFQKYAATTTLEPFAFPHHTFVHTTDTFFADPKMWFSALTKWAATTSHSSCVIDPEFVQLTLHALVNLFGDTRLAEYAIAVTFACNNDLGKKYGKRLLKERSSNLRLYNAVALMYWRTGDHDTAHNVWSTALSMSQNFDTRELTDSALLWNSWIWEMLHTGEKERASYLLQAMPYNQVQLPSYQKADKIEINQPNFLRVKQASHHPMISCLFASQKNALKFKKMQAYAAYADCYAITLYLLGEPLDEVLDVYNNAVTSLRVLPKTDNDFKVLGGELLHQARARIMYHYVEKQSGQFKPADVRTVLLDSLEWWPHNTMFLSLFKWNEARLQLTDRTRDIFDVTIGAKARAERDLQGPAPIHRVPVTTHLFSIYAEMGRPIMLGSTPHSIRAAFERAIGDDGVVPIGRTPTRKSPFELASSTSAQSNLTIWRLYILYELYAEHDVGRARQIYFRALRSCPWSKELYLLAFEHLRADLTNRLPPCRLTRAGEVNPSGFNTAELRALYTEMLRRGLRVHYHVEGHWAQ
ncbi:Tetratricopeptide-like helical [Penicillium concentricum]|uniref:Tetratricopeptide-like helical n=1 Tax=Penicillium concentricum TaxID=293559 RepID=A0A9W9SAE9_9EURO|nr:Tetratricopeptide-like helical [Penicillium concentricum]KAJ5374537.1 Tetratricopeptide-like helical [Penicillium concentricum]